MGDVHTHVHTRPGLTLPNCVVAYRTGTVRQGDQFPAPSCTRMKMRFPPNGTVFLAVNLIAVPGLLFDGVTCIHRTPERLSFALTRTRTAEPTAISFAPDPATALASVILGGVKSRMMSSLYVFVSSIPEPEKRT